jgi:hypothetical protein
MPEPLPVPVCKTCYKDLPMTFQGFDICPWCLYLAEQRAVRPHRALPRYETPLARLERETRGSRV